MRRSTTSPTEAAPGAAAQRPGGTRPSSLEREGRDGTGDAFDFPPGFLLGAATAGHQVEGGNRWSDWWAFERAGRVPHESGAACGHWELYERDFDIARAAGQNAHRLSLEWSRIEPREGAFDAQALRHYADVVDALRDRGLTPVVTLHHFTLPLWAAESGGWADRRCVFWFARYVDRVAEAIGDRVRLWVTVNEPTVYVKHGYVVGDWPPGRRRAWAAGARALRNLARAHRLARRRLRAQLPAALVGFAHSAPVIQPCDAGRTRDRSAAWIRDVALNRLFFALLGRSSRRRPPFDFIGLNYYTRTVVRGAGRGIVPFAGTECLDDHHTDRGPTSAMGWEVYPRGLGDALRRFAAYGVPLLVTENGVATDDEVLRARFLKEHLAQVAGALRDGIDVRGYFYWSLMDNFEWALGTTPRFGLMGVDFATQHRHPRPALEEFAAVCRTRRLGPLPIESPAAPLLGADDPA